MGSGQSRRGQNAASAAILVALVGGALIIYILMLPPGQREALLFGDGQVGGYRPGPTGGGGGVFTQYGPVLIFKETPGTLRMLKSSTVEHNIPSATIYTAINTEEVKSIDSAIVKNGVFARRAVDIDFQARRQGSRNFLLSFNVDEAGYGRLRVILNGHLIYERPIRERSPTPISLPADYMIDGENRLVIETDDPGFAFWRSNTYVLHNILISADVFDERSAAVAQQFSLPESELGAFEAAQLQFVPDCREAGRLVVQLNSKLVRMDENRTIEVPNIIYSGLPDCGVMFKTDISKEQLRVGENTILFASQDGEYIIDRVKLIVRLRQNEYPVYYFNLPREMYDTLDLGEGQLRMTMTFVDYRNMKSGEIVVNGFVQSFNVQDYAYQAVLDPGILNPGPNTLQIIPHIDRLDIAEVKIELV